MKGLMKYLSPFAPDISGAAAVLFEMKGLIIIIDAGGCAGNVCGFDEPRWFHERSAVFSAGLRDLDAIMGRDDKLMEKAGDALSHMDARFLALIGTPVPSVIATDYQALKRMGESRFGVPTFPIATTGMQLYDRGQEKAYLALFSEYIGGKAAPAQQGTSELGVLGATPMDLVNADSFASVRARLSDGRFDRVRIFGETLEDFQAASGLKEILVISPSGLSAAELLKKRCGIPYSVCYPLPEGFAEAYTLPDGARKVLILHQAVLAETLREKLSARYPEAEIDTATFFDPYGSCRHLAGEDAFLSLFREGGYDVVIADPLLARACRGWEGTFLPLPHFAVSGSLEALEQPAARHETT